MDIRPEEPGEFWVNERGGKILTYTGARDGDRVLKGWHVCGMEVPIGNLIHGKSGWQRISPPVIDLDKLGGNLRKIFTNHALDDNEGAISDIIDLMEGK
jgi:hypothetical protein